MSIKVMIVDDSALVRQVITQAISRDPAIEVVALPDIARMLPEWQPERLTMQLRQAMIDWSAHAAPALGQARAA